MASLARCKWRSRILPTVSKVKVRVLLPLLVLGQMQTVETRFCTAFHPTTHFNAHKQTNILLP